METYPVGASRQNEINARSAMYGAGVAPKEPVETLPISQGDAAAPAARPVVRRAFDASEGTALDPLRSKGWDLNATQNVPGPAPQPASSRRR